MWIKIKIKNTHTKKHEKMLLVLFNASIISKELSQNCWLRKKKGRQSAINNNYFAAF